MKTTPLITLLSSLFAIYGQPLVADGTSPAFPLKSSENRPRDGKATVIGEYPNKGEREFTPPDLPGEK